MRITFFADDPRWSGLSNGGGTRTLVLSAQTLRELGHNVSIVAHKDGYSWDKHPKPIHNVPKNTDILIAVTISDVKHVMKYKGMRLAYYSRPVECDTKGHKWQMSQKKALATLRKFTKKYKGVIISNSGWQIKWLKKHGIKSHLVYSGQNLTCVNPRTREGWLDGHSLSLFCQYSDNPAKGWKEFVNISKLCGDKYDYFAFGSKKCKAFKYAKKPSLTAYKFLTNYYQNPSRDDLNFDYQCKDIFFCTSKREGFYNCGVEAVMNGCLLIGNSNYKNGCVDYLTPETGYIYNNTNEVPALLKSLDIRHRTHDKMDEVIEKVTNCQKLIKEKIGSRSDNMRSMIKVLK